VRSERGKKRPLQLSGGPDLGALPSSSDGLHSRILSFQNCWVLWLVYLVKRRGDESAAAEVEGQEDKVQNSIPCCDMFS